MNFAAVLLPSEGKTTRLFHEEAGPRKEGPVDVLANPLCGATHLAFFCMDAFAGVTSSMTSWRQSFIVPQLNAELRAHASRDVLRVSSKDAAVVCGQEAAVDCGLWSGGGCGLWTGAGP